jgi:hypothetical protein
MHACSAVNDLVTQLVMLASSQISELGTCFHRGALLRETFVRARLRHVELVAAHFSGLFFTDRLLYCRQCEVAYRRLRVDESI